MSRVTKKFIISAGGIPTRRLLMNVTQQDRCINEQAFHRLNFAIEYVRCISCKKNKPISNRPIDKIKILNISPGKECQSHE